MPTTNSTNYERGESSVRQLWPIWTSVAIIVIWISWRILIPPRPEPGANQMTQDDKRLIDEYLSRVQVSRGNEFTAEQRERIYEVAQTDLMKLTLRGISEKPPNEQEKLLEGIVRMALVRSGETLPVPSEITASILAETSDADLSPMLYDFVCNRFSSTGAYKGGDESFRRALLSLPRGLRVVFNMSTLDGEIYNGGVAQLFTNSSGTYLTEMLEDCGLIGAKRHAVALKEAITKWQPGSRFEAAESELNEWDRRYYALENTEPLHALITKYLRSHPDDCLTSPVMKK
jgi:hypothetical protein